MDLPCFETELSDGGDYVTLRYMDHPLFVVRDQEGSLNAYHNVCRHRGCEVLEGKGNTKTTIMCPYHRWTYQLDGELRGVPNEGECFENLPREELSLHRASVGVCGHGYSLTPSANPKEDFSSWIANMDDIFGLIDSTMDRWSVPVKWFIRWLAIGKSFTKTPLMVITWGTCMTKR